MRYSLILFILITGALWPFTTWSNASNHPGGPSLNPSQKAELLLSRQEFAQALKAYQGMLAAGDSGSPVFRGLVKSYQGLGERADAFLLNYDRAHPGLSSVQYGLGYWYYLQDENQLAELHFKESLARDPKNALAWNNRGALKTRTKSYSEALTMVRRAIKLEPDNQLFYNNLWVIYGEMGSPGLFLANYKKYVADADKILALGYGKTLAKSLRQESFRHYAEGDLDHAIDKNRQLVQIYREIDHTPGLVAGLFGLGLLYEEAGREDEAQDSFRQVLKINPQHIQARERLSR